MSTRFGRFILSKSFSTLLSILMPLATFLTGWQLERTICIFLGRSHIWGIPCALLLLFSFLSIVYARPSQKKITRMTYAVKYTTCFLIYDIFLTLPWFFVCLILPIPEVWEAIITIGLVFTAGILVAVGRINSKKLTSTKYEISIEECKKHFCIALISDLHLGMFVRSDHVKKVVQCINSMKPDLVVIAGDILDVDHSILEDQKELNAIAMQLQSLSSNLGTYLAAGNHDPNIENHVFQKFIRNSNIRLLHNEAIEFSDFILAGRTDDTNNERKQIADILSPIDRGKPVILIDHNPQGIIEAQQYGIPLVLSGHTHKGQFFPMDFFTKWANGKHYFYGHEILGTTQAIISSGAGYFNLPVRIGSKNEVVEITITVQ